MFSLTMFSVEFEKRRMVCLEIPGIVLYPLAHFQHFTHFVASGELAIRGLNPRALWRTSVLAGVILKVVGSTKTSKN